MLPEEKPLRPTHVVPLMNPPRDPPDQMASSHITDAIPPQENLDKEEQEYEPKNKSIISLKNPTAEGLYRVSEKAARNLSWGVVRTTNGQQQQTRHQPRAIRGMN